MDYYELVRGPCAIFAFTIFGVGVPARFLYIFFRAKGQPILYPRQMARDGARALLAGFLPGRATYMHQQPFFTAATFIFHICLLLTPLFLLAHVVLWYESWELLWWDLPDLAADMMTILVILGCLFFLLRRLIQAEARAVTRPADYVVLALVLLPFLSGFMAGHQWGPYRFFLVLHILSGELLLIYLPFSKLIHMILFPFTRSHLGAQFGKAMQGNQW